MGIEEKVLDMMAEEMLKDTMKMIEEDPTTLEIILPSESETTDPLGTEEEEALLPSEHEWTIPGTTLVLSSIKTPGNYQQLNFQLFLLTLPWAGKAPGRWSFQKLTQLILPE